jgi:hypothetical protein
LIGTERFGEASGRSNGPLRMKDQKSVGGRETIFGGNVEDRTECKKIEQIGRREIKKKKRRL